MFRYIVRRLLQMVLAFFGTTLIVYALMFAGQGDPIQALAGERPVSEAQRAYLTEKFNLDHTGIGGFFYRYFDYIGNLLRGDLGDSLTGRKISDMLAQAWPVTMKLAVIGLLVAIVVGVTSGVIAGLRRGGIFDNATLALTLLVLGVPTIVLAPLAQYFLGVKLPLFPPTAGSDPSLYALLLPGIVLGSLSLATALRLTRTSVAENLRSDYVRTAKAKGMTTRRIVSVHVLRNSLIPVITFLGVELGNLMSGAIITEGVFNIPGVGFNLFRGIRTEDGPLVVGLVSVLVVVFLVSNLVVDILYAVLDPRIRYE
ncbi:ABC transporter permease [Plantactinospora soyae]|uniref:Peptide/nickel transport system permease protein/oligopeptide transport system permease protein n=1 Tax=Plantactinospora soyae TaxID=1544732 RepID=A0A927M1G2_9ACTN|nr:ABC transporter permease [Plantactinospora soyae]MBE1484976.1 peptide/nickel transport system permease protein/oligopeptide transport system permease protein [Plantactinospora soyae]